MSPRRAVVAAATGLALAAGLVGCGESQEPAQDEGISIELPDTPDCDKGDRKKKERPDCGRLVSGRYVEWSWVKAGRTTPPPGWSPAREPGVNAPKRPASKPSTKKATVTRGR